MIPNAMPTLSAGAHDPGKGKACVMEYVSLLAGEAWSDSPSCTHPVLAAAARRVNDRLPDSERHVLVPLIGRLFGTAESGTEHERKVLSVRLAVWSTRQVLHLVPESRRAAAVRAVECAEGWCEGRVSEQECATAVATDDATTVAAAFDAVAFADADDDATFLTGLIDEYDRLTGRATHRALTPADYAHLAAAVR